MKAHPEGKRLVAKGKNYPGYKTREVTYAMEPLWHPQREPLTEEVDIDPSDYRKQNIEQRIADA